MLINELQERYDITRKPLYSRIKSLELDLGKNADNKTFANEEQVKLLDQLHDHLKAGGKLKSFVPITDVEIENGHDTVYDTTKNITTQYTTQPKTEPSSQDDRSTASNSLVPINQNEAFTTRATTQESIITTHPTTQPNQQELLAQIALLITEAKDPLWNLSALERAIDNEWLLTTAQIKNLIGTKPYCKKGKSSYERGSFLFTKSGKIGNQTAWKVSKK